MHLTRIFEDHFNLNANLSRIDNARSGSRTRTTLRSQDFKSCSENAQLMDDTGVTKRGETLGKPVGKTDPELEAVMTAWDTLPAALRAGIVAMVKAAKGTGAG